MALKTAKPPYDVEGAKGRGQELPGGRSTWRQSEMTVSMFIGTATRTPIWGQHSTASNTLETNTGGGGCKRTGSHLSHRSAEGQPRDH